MDIDINTRYNSGIELTSKQYSDFVNSEVGTVIIRQLKVIRNQIAEAMAMGGCLDDSIEKTAQNYATNTGQIQGINWLLDPNIVEGSDEA